MSINDPYNFGASSALRGYNPNLISNAPAAQSGGTMNMSDTERLAQLMQGNLSGQLDTSDKLAALSALLRSVGRGSQVSPQQALQQFQQQKMQEVQGKIQLEQLRKSAQRKAELDALKAQYVANAPNPQSARELQLMSDEDFSSFLREKNKPTQQSLEGIRAQLADLYGFGTPAYNQALKAYIERQQTFTGPGGGVYTQKPVTLPSLPTGTPQGAGVPNRAEVLAELKKRGVI